MDLQQIVSQSDGAGALQDGDIVLVVRNGKILRANIGDVTEATIAEIPAEAGLGDLLSTNNLSDLDDEAQARDNLGLGTAAISDADDFVDLTTEQKIENKRRKRRVVTAADSATITPNADTTDLLTVAELSQATDIANHTGTPDDGDQLEIRIKTTSARALTHGNKYRGSDDVALLEITVAGKEVREIFEWNEAAAMWDLLATNSGH